jgi:hypothetical protein
MATLILLFMTLVDLLGLRMCYLVVYENFVVCA